MISTQRSLAGVEIVLLASGEQSIHYVHVETKRGLLFFVSKENTLTNVKVLSQKLSNNIPLVLVLNGKGIITREISPQINEDQEIVSQLLPGARVSDFYIQKYIAHQMLWVSLVRRAVVDGILKSLTEHGYSVFSVSSGPFSSLNYLPPLEENQSCHEFAGHRIFLEKGVLRNYEYKEYAKDFATIAIDEQEWDERLLMARGIAIDYAVNQNVEAQFTVGSIASSRKDFSEKRLFKKLIVAIPVLFFIMLLINFYLFQLLFARNRELNLMTKAQERRQSRATTLATDISKKEEFIQRSGWSMAVKSSYYADRLASTLPESVRLLNMNIIPYDEQQSKKMKIFVFKNSVIEIEGYCTEPGELNLWIRNLKGLDWVKSVNLDNYAFDKRTSKANFLVQITI